MKQHEANSYNLVDQPWLLVRQLDGRTVELSLLDTFRHANQIASLAGDVPTQVFALTRLLLAILHGATAGPRDLTHWKQLWAAELLPVDAIETYLDRHRDRFDLFHPKTPFMQVADLHTAKGDVSDLSKLIADVPNGHPFFSTRLDPCLSLSFAEAARWVVHCQAFDSSGIKSGAVGDERVKGGKGYPIGTGWSGYLGGVLAEGANLRETLLLNLIPRDFGDTGRAPVADVPVWENDQLTAAVSDPDGRAPTGPVDLFTWQSRRIRLFAENDQVTGVLICNGDRITPQNKHNSETHTGWRRSQAQEKKLKSTTPVYMPLEHDPERAIWRGLESLLPGTAKHQGKDASARLSSTVIEWVSSLTNRRVIAKHFPLRMRTIGMTYGSQSSTTAEIIDDALSIQAVLLTQDAADLTLVVLSCVDAAESAAKALGSLAANLTAAGGGDPDGPRTRAVESAYAELDPKFRAWLSQLGPSADATTCQVDWHGTANKAIRELAFELLDASSPGAWVGRVVNKRLVTSNHAKTWFHRDLRQALSYAYPEPVATA
jgi:CRISPR system Cascade subunit CasA